MTFRNHPWATYLSMAHSIMESRIKVKSDLTLMKAIKSLVYLEPETEPCHHILNKINQCAQENLWEPDYQANRSLKIEERAATAAVPSVAPLCPLKSADTEYSVTGKRKSKEWTKTTLDITAEKTLLKTDLDITVVSSQKSKWRRSWTTREVLRRFIILQPSVRLKPSRFLKLKSFKEVRVPAAISVHLENLMMTMMMIW